ncbi:collagen alpha-1(III) chain-like [Rattus rattus]|uniref:collagen alpha-1(III) chain-like n=1 Tax=Rattus rattus TaxID=10117 RepID=UPI0013F393D5|nr:collagen alpha-1(III) chain-like [Rattus rattus]
MRREAYRLLGQWCTSVGQELEVWAVGSVGWQPLARIDVPVHFAVEDSASSGSYTYRVSIERRTGREAYGLLGKGGHRAADGREAHRLLGRVGIEALTGRGSPAPGAVGIEAADGAEAYWLLGKGGHRAADGARGLPAPGAGWASSGGRGARPTGSWGGVGIERRTGREAYGLLGKGGHRAADGARGLPAPGAGWASSGGRGARPTGSWGRVGIERQTGREAYRLLGRGIGADGREGSPAPGEGVGIEGGRARAYGLQGRDERGRAPRPTRAPGEGGHRAADGREAHRPGAGGHRSGRTGAEAHGLLGRWHRSGRTARGSPLLGKGWASRADGARGLPALGKVNIEAADGREAWAPGEGGHRAADGARGLTAQGRVGIMDGRPGPLPWGGWDRYDGRRGSRAPGEKVNIERADGAEGPPVPGKGESIERADGREAHGSWGRWQRAGGFERGPRANPGAGASTRTGVRPTAPGGGWASKRADGAPGPRAPGAGGMWPPGPGARPTALGRVWASRRADGREGPTGLLGEVGIEPADRGGASSADGPRPTGLGRWASSGGRGAEAYGSRGGVGIEGGRGVEALPPGEGVGIERGRALRLRARGGGIERRTGAEATGSWGGWASKRADGARGHGPGAVGIEARTLRAAPGSRGGVGIERRTGARPTGSGEGVASSVADGREGHCPGAGGYRSGRTGARLTGSWGGGIERADGREATGPGAGGHQADLGTGPRAPGEGWASSWRIGREATAQGRVGSSWIWREAYLALGAQWTRAGQRGLPRLGHIQWALSCGWGVRPTGS